MSCFRLTFTLYIIICHHTLTVSSLDEGKSETHCHDEALSGHNGRNTFRTPITHPAQTVRRCHSGCEPAHQEQFGGIIDGEIKMNDAGAPQTHYPSWSPPGGPPRETSPIPPIPLRVSRWWMCIGAVTWIILMDFKEVLSSFTSHYWRSGYSISSQGKIRL